MSVAEICTRDVLTVEEHESVLTAVKLMRENHVGDVVVIRERDGKRIPVGILTDRDILLEVIAEDLDADSISAGDAMSYELLTAEEGDELGDVVKRMRSKGVRRIPVVDKEGGLVGILSFDDIVELLAEQMTDLAALIQTEQRHELVQRA